MLDATEMLIIVVGSLTSSIILCMCYRCCRKKKEETRLTDIRKSVSRTNKVKPFIKFIDDNNNDDNIITINNNGEKEIGIRIGEPIEQENV